MKAAGAPKRIISGTTMAGNRAKVVCHLLVCEVNSCSTMYTCPFLFLFSFSITVFVSIYVLYISIQMITNVSRLQLLFRSRSVTPHEFSLHGGFDAACTNQGQGFRYCLSISMATAAHHDASPRTCTIVQNFSHFGFSLTWLILVILVSVI